MKTIEETALEIARYAYDFDKADKEWLIGNLALMISIVLHEQKKIDIEKACEWLRWIMENGSSYRVFPNKQSIEDFRKAMEE